MSLIGVSKTLQLCKGRVTAPSKRAKNISASRTRPAQIGTHKLSPPPPAWPSGVLQPSFTFSKIQHTNPTTKWSTIRTYATQPGAQNDDTTEEAAMESVKALTDILSTLAIPGAARTKLAGWIEQNYITVDTLATYADPKAEARKEGLPQDPFVALVRKAKKLRASDDVKKTIEFVGQINFPASDTTVLVDWILTNKVTLDILATYTDPAKEATQRNLPEGPFVALVKKVMEVRPPNALTLEDVYSHAKTLEKHYKKSSPAPESTYIRRRGAHEVGLDLVERQNLGPFIQGETRPNAYRYGVIGGAVGAGKTRMAQEFLGNLQDDLKKRHPSFFFSYVRVVLPSSDWDPKDSNLEDKASKELALNLVIGHFISGVPERSYPDVAKELLKLNPLYANLVAVEHLIFQSTVSQHGSDASKCVILHLDECQQIPTVIEHCIKALQRRLRSYQEIHLLPLFVGLSPSSVVNIRESSYTGTRIPLPLLDDEDSGALLYDFCSLISRRKSLPEPSVGWSAYCRKSKHFPQLLRLFAGHPQVLRLLADAIVDLQPRNPDHLDESAAAEALAAVKKHFWDLYYPKVFTDHPLSSEGAASLIKMAFFGEVVPVSTKINGLTVADVEKSGLISTIPADPRDPLNVRVAWPLWTYFWLDSHLKMNIFSKQLEDTIFKLDSTNLAKMVAHLHLASIHILTNAHRTTTTTTMQYLYFDQLEADQELLDTVITLKASTKIKEAYLTRRSPKQPWEPLNPKAIQVITSKATTSETVDLSTGRFIVVTPPRYPGADVLLPYAQEQYKGSLDMDQMEPIPATKTLTTSQVNVEIGKFVVPNLPLIFVSPKPHNGPSPYKNVGFVCGDNFFRFTRGFVAATTDFSQLVDMQSEQDPSL